MKVFNCVFGVISIIAAIYCIFYPGVAFLNSGWIVAVLLGVWGICAIADYMAKRKKEDKSKTEAAMGVLGLVAGIAAAVVSILALFIPSIRMLLDIIILSIFAGWLIISGITSAAVSFKTRKAGSKRWVLTLVCGILVLLAGIYGVFHLIFVAQTIGILIGILLMIYGIRLVLSVVEKGR